MQGHAENTRHFRDVNVPLFAHIVIFCYKLWRTHATKSYQSDVSSL